jgi:hypothetical protein
MSSSESKLNVTPEAVRLVAEGLSSELLPQKLKERYTSVQRKKHTSLERFLRFFGCVSLLDVCFHVYPY